MFVTMANLSWRGTRHTEPSRNPHIKLIRVKLRETNLYRVNYKRNKAVAVKDALDVSSCIYSCCLVTDYLIYYRPEAKH